MLDREGIGIQLEGARAGNGAGNQSGSAGVVNFDGDRRVGGMLLIQQSASKLPASLPQVYSYGVLAFPLGMILIAWGLSCLP